MKKLHEKYTNNLLYIPTLSIDKGEEQESLQGTGGEEAEDDETP